MPRHVIPADASWGKIVGSIANDRSASYDYSGTVTSDGVNVVDSTGKLEIVKPGKYLLIANAWTDASMASGFGGFYLNILKNGSPVSGSPGGAFMANAEQVWSGAGSPEKTQYNQAGSVCSIQNLIATDIINAEAVDIGDDNDLSTGDQYFEVIAIRIGD